MNHVDILLENLLASLPIQLVNPVQWWAQLSFGTIEPWTLLALAIIPAWIGLALSSWLGQVLARYKTVSVSDEVKLRIEIVMMAVLLLPGIPFKGLLILLAGVFGLRWKFLLAAAMIGQLAHYSIAVFATQDSHTLGWALRVMGFLPS